MKNKTKALLIPIAAFAVTVTGVNAFSSDMLVKADLSTEQVSAFEEARELRMRGDKKAARDVLVEAGVDMETIQSVREAMAEHQNEMHISVEDAIKNGDYEAFLTAVENMPMFEAIDTPEEFDQFIKAYELREAGDKQSAHAIMKKLGFDGQMMKENGHGMHKEKKDKDIPGMIDEFDHKDSEEKKGQDHEAEGMM